MSKYNYLTDNDTSFKAIWAWAKQLVNALNKAEAVYGDYADDIAAAAAGVPVNGRYRTGSFLKIRVS